MNSETLANNDSSSSPKRVKIMSAIQQAIRDTNETLARDCWIGETEAEKILGEGSNLDSLGFVTLMVSVETEMTKSFGSCPSLTEELLAPSSDIDSIGRLADFLSLRV